MKRNGFDKEMCSDYFQAYRDCKKEWVSTDHYALFLRPYYSLAEITPRRNDSTPILGLLSVIDGLTHLSS
ncbi:hypothetical protein ASPTUDRAFT_46810 [Aspergillus tubingensis CBS 134.48]|uniref:CHCH domain-containing protein n=1 Tax=Aspergillus tubingensis (strain CBS 134.48) TaxID=767770 RepID=A0A1L9MWM6_ASPTC|nr:hypothetical protein ASPTUDRAFT_46810 [Aspergillus tubingensis CBS 134.48]